MINLKLNLKHAGVEQKTIMQYKERVEEIHEELHKRANIETDFVGWIELPTNYDKEEFERIKQAAKRIQEDSEVLIVVVPDFEITFTEKSFVPRASIKSFI